MAPPVGGACRLLVGFLSAVSCASCPGEPPGSQPSSHPITAAKQASTQATTTQVNAGMACGEQCHCQQHILSCAGGHAGTLLTEVPIIEGHNDTFFYIDFSGNTIPEVHKRSWLTYSWTETLILKDNHLQKLEKDSFEGLLLLKYLDLSHNKINYIADHVFEPAPFLQSLNLADNKITKINNGTFEAWHFLPFLTIVHLRNNPLTVISDSSFFQLGVLKKLNLGGTNVMLQTVKTILLTSLSLETLILPYSFACCLCQAEKKIEFLCNKVALHCNDVCDMSSSLCKPADILPATEDEFLKTLQIFRMNSTAVLHIEPEQPLLWDSEDNMMESSSNQNYPIAQVNFNVEVNLVGSIDDLSPSSMSSCEKNKTSTTSMPMNKTTASGDPTVMSPKFSTSFNLHWGVKEDLRKLSFLEKLLSSELQNKAYLVIKNQKSNLSRATKMTTPALHDNITNTIAKKKTIRKRRDLIQNDIQQPRNAFAEKCFGRECLIKKWMQLQSRKRGANDAHRTLQRDETANNSPFVIHDELSTQVYPDLRSYLLSLLSLIEDPSDLFSADSKNLDSSNNTEANKWNSVTSSAIGYVQEKEWNFPDTPEANIFPPENTTVNKHEQKMDGISNKPAASEEWPLVTTTASEFVQNNNPNFYEASEPKESTSGTNTDSIFKLEKDLNSSDTPETNQWALETTTSSEFPQNSYSNFYEASEPNESTTGSSTVSVFMLEKDWNSPDTPESDHWPLVTTTVDESVPEKNWNLTDSPKLKNWLHVATTTDESVPESEWNSPDTPKANHWLLVTTTDSESSVQENEKNSLDTLKANPGNFVTISVDESMQPKEWNSRDTPEANNWSLVSSTADEYVQEMKGNSPDTRDENHLPPVTTTAEDSEQEMETKSPKTPSKNHWPLVTTTPNESEQGKEGDYPVTPEIYLPHMITTTDEYLQENEWNSTDTPDAKQWFYATPATNESEHSMITTVNESEQENKWDSPDTPDENHLPPVTTNDEESEEKKELNSDAPNANQWPLTATTADESVEQKEWNAPNSPESTEYMVNISIPDYFTEDRESNTLNNTNANVMMHVTITTGESVQNSKARFSQTPRVKEWITGTTTAHKSEPVTEGDFSDIPKLDAFTPLTSSGSKSYASHGENKWTIVSTTAHKSKHPTVEAFSNTPDADIWNSVTTRPTVSNLVIKSNTPEKSKSANDTITAHESEQQENIDYSDISGENELMPAIMEGIKSVQEEENPASEQDESDELPVVSAPINESMQNKEEYSTETSELANEINTTGLEEEVTYSDTSNTFEAIELPFSSSAGHEKVKQADANISDTPKEQNWFSLSPTTLENYSSGSILKHKVTLVSTIAEVTSSTPELSSVSTTDNVISLTNEVSLVSTTAKVTSLTHEFSHVSTTPQDALLRNEVVRPLNTTAHITPLTPKVSPVSTTDKVTSLTPKVSTVSTTAKVTSLIHKVSTVSTTAKVTSLTHKVSPVSTTAKVTSLKHKVSPVSTTAKVTSLTHKVSPVSTTAKVTSLTHNVNPVSTTAKVVLLTNKVSSLNTTTHITPLTSKIGLVSTTANATTLTHEGSPLMTNGSEQQKSEDSLQKNSERKTFKPKPVNPSVGNEQTPDLSNSLIQIMQAGPGLNITLNADTDDKQNWNISEAQWNKLLLNKLLQSNSDHIVKTGKLIENSGFHVANKTGLKRKSNNKGIYNTTEENEDNEGVLFEQQLSTQLESLIPKKEVRTLVCHIIRILKMECSKPNMKLACEKLVSKTGLLMKVFSEREMQEQDSTWRVYINESLGETKKEKYTGYGNSMILPICVGALILIIIAVTCCVERACRKKHEKEKEGANLEEDEGREPPSSLTRSNMLPGSVPAMLNKAPHVLCFPMPDIIIMHVGGNDMLDLGTGSWHLSLRVWLNPFGFKIYSNHYILFGGKIWPGQKTLKSHLKKKRFLTKLPLGGKKMIQPNDSLANPDPIKEIFRTVPVTTTKT